MIPTPAQAIEISYAGLGFTVCYYCQEYVQPQNTGISSESLPRPWQLSTIPKALPTWVKDETERQSQIQLCVSGTSGE